MFHGNKIHLRQIDEKDISTILAWENDSQNWRFGETEAPFSLFEIKSYVETASQVRTNRQLRMMICLNKDNQAIGTIDLYDIDFRHKRAGVGILIAEKENRQKGYAKEALFEIEKYALEILNLFQLYCEIHANNQASIQLFEGINYQKTGIKKNWTLFKNEFIDVLFYQKFLSE